jgi:ubiquinone/menaquinone biosynthesis C-methylase UbiE
MSEANVKFSGSIPELYDRHLGPVMFEPYAADLAQRVAAKPTGSVLEIACGTGIVTQRLRTHLDPVVPLVATDLNQPMIDYARATKFREDSPHLEWRQADAVNLPFPDSSFAVVVCQFGLMFVPDKPAAFREARRVLANGGLFAFNVWDSLANNPYAQIAYETVSEFFPTDPPRFFEVPYGFHNPDVLRSLLTDHGFERIQIEHVPLEAVSTSARSLATGLVTGTPVSLAIHERGGSFEPIVEAVTAALSRLGGAAPFRSPMQAVIVTARASQI